MVTVFGSATVTVLVMICVNTFVLMATHNAIALPIPRQVGITAAFASTTVYLGSDTR